MVARANGRRGEVEALIDGERRILCLTLGALAELETALGLDNVAEIAARFSEGRIDAKALIALIGAGLRGGGNTMSDDDVRDCFVEGGVAGAMKLSIALLTSAFDPHGAGPPDRP